MRNKKNSTYILLKEYDAVNRLFEGQMFVLGGIVFEKISNILTLGLCVVKDNEERMWNLPADIVVQILHKS